MPTQARIYYDQSPNHGQSPEQLTPFRDKIFKALVDEDDSLQAQITAISGGGIGDVVGPASSVDQDIVIFDGTTGKLIADSGVTTATLLGDVFEGALHANAATTAALPACTYNNGTLGVGATLTKNTNGTFPTIDTVTAIVGRRYIIKNQATQLQNGVYELTTLGTAGTPWVLTRTTDSDEDTEFDGQVVIVGSGSTNLRKVFSQRTALPIIGTNNIVYGQTSAGNIFSDGRKDFTDTQSWDAGTGETVEIDPALGIVLTDPVIAPGTTFVTTLQQGYIAVNDGGGSIMQLSAYGLSSVDPSTNSVGFSADRIEQSTITGGTYTVKTKLVILELSANDIQTLNSTPIVIVASPGVGKVIIPKTAFTTLTVGGILFTNTHMHIRADGVSDDLCFFETGTFLNLGASYTVQFAHLSAKAPTVLENTAIVVNANADSGVGNGSVKIWMTYDEITYS